MKTLMMFFAILLIAITLNSCSESNDPSDDVSVSVKSHLLSETAGGKIAVSKDGNILKSEVDSIKINKVRILLSRIMFHSDAEKNDSTNNLLKTGPYLFVGDTSGTYFDLANGALPKGLYDKIKFEMHRFSGSELGEYVNNEVFTDFATQDRFSAIIDGIVYEAGQEEVFTYHGTPTANLSLKFDPSIEFVDGQANEISSQIDPMDLFSSGTTIYDPRDPKNQNDIDNLIKKAIKAIKK
jgi:hypothetical protein